MTTGTAAKEEPGKLTLRMSQRRIKQAKQVAKERDISVSQLVEDYIAGLAAPPLKIDIDEYKKTLTPRVRAIFGIAKGANFDVQDYYDYLEEKYS